MNSVASLIAVVNAGQRVKFLYFWGHRPEPDGRVGAGCLSQWWPSSFVVDGRSFATAEHFMMWRKATLFGDTEVAGRIRDAGHPHQAKDLGRAVRGFDQARWEQERFGIVVEANYEKFRQNPSLAEFLRRTGERVLVEASPVDRIWGIGLAATDERAAVPAQWLGLNLLGFALMAARSMIRADQH